MTQYQRKTTMKQMSKQCVNIYVATEANIYRPPTPAPISLDVLLLSLFSFSAADKEPLKGDFNVQCMFTIEIASYSVMQSAVSQLKSGNHIGTRGC